MKRSIFATWRLNFFLIARPGEETDKGSEDYVTHRDYSTSARINAFLNTGKKRFYVQYLGDTFELTIRKP